MKLKMTVISTAAVLALAVAAENKGAAQALAGNGVEISPQVYNFGEVDASVKTLRGQFVLRNRGAAELRVEEVVPTCSCTQVEWSDGAVAPGDSCIIAFVYNKDSYTTSFIKDINVRTSLSSEPVLLRISGVFVESEASMTAQYHFRHGDLGLERESIMLGRVYEGESATEIVRVANLSGKEVSVAVGECPDGVSAEFLSERLKPLETGFLRVKVVNAPIGWTEFSIVPLVDGEKAEAVGVRLMTVPDFREADEQRQREGPYPLMETKRVVIEAAAGQTSASAKLSLENLSDEQMTIYAAQVLNPRFKLNFPGRVAANETVSLEVSLDSTGLESGEYYEKMYLITNSPAMPVTEIDVVYYIR